MASVVRTSPREDIDDGSRIGYVHSSETTSAVNGPGLRYTVFLSGCPLRCLYCHNPDTQGFRLGGRTTALRVITEAGRYAPFMRRSGGLTITGGEPLLQAPFVEDLFVGVKERFGMHTVLDTSAANSHRATQNLLDHTDLVLLDIKAGNDDRYAKVTGTGSLKVVLDFAERLMASRIPVWIRFVLVPGLTDDPAHVAQVAGISAWMGDIVERVEVLPYHTMGLDKYEALGREYPLPGVPTPTQEQVSQAVGIFRDHGLYTLV